MDLVAISWQRSTRITNAHVAETRNWARISLFLETVVFVTVFRTVKKNLFLNRPQNLQEQKAGLLVSPEEVTVLGSIDLDNTSNAATSQFTA